MPSKEWVNSFVKRNSTLLSHLVCQNISPSRASVSPAMVESFFSHYAQSIDGVPPENLLNFDETNLSDDPGRKKVFMKKGTKYPERIMSHSKSAVSIMYAGCADGIIATLSMLQSCTYLRIMNDRWSPKCSIQ